ncbi:UNVERIFIED_CONTAM: hypothetical protein NCL1_49945 [Trichonephila clavipes]
MVQDGKAKSVKKGKPDLDDLKQEVAMRKIFEENRLFQDDWEVDCSVVEKHMEAYGSKLEKECL